MEEAAAAIAALSGATHVTRAPAAPDAIHSVVTADLDNEAVDTALHTLDRLGVPSEDVSLLRQEEIHHGRRRRRAHTGVVWADLVGQAGENARPVARYLVFMAAAGVIAGYGVIYANGILIVGA